MLYIYIVMLAALSLLFLLTIPYKWKERRDIDRRKSRLSIIYGLSMFIVDKLPDRLIYRDDKNSDAIRKLTVKDNIKRQKYLYIVEKVSISLAVMWIALLAGAAICVKQSKDVRISFLPRSSISEESFSLEVKDEKGNSEDIEVDVEKKKFTVEAAHRAINKNKKKLVKTVLDKNESCGKVDTSLNLVSEIGDEDIEVLWDISEPDVMGYDGKIGEDISDEGEPVTLTAKMSLDGVSESYSFAICVFPAKEQGSLRNEVQNHINENDVYEDKVSLPETIAGEKVSYYKQREKAAEYVGAAGIILAIIMFFLKDRDFKEKTEKRERQMQRDYPELLSRIMLYYGAGLSVKSLFERIVKEYKSRKREDKTLFKYAYEELELAVAKMNSGIAEKTAIHQFGTGCGLHCYLKLSGILEQNMKRGTVGFSHMLRMEMESAIFEWKNNALKEGEKLSAKMLGPMMLMLIVTMVIIIVPAFLTLNI